MRLLPNQGPPRSAVRLLAQRGYDVVHTGDIGMARSTDAEIMDRAEEEERVVVTLDSDFHALLAARRAVQPSVIRIRIEGLRGPELVEIFVAALAASEDELREGAAVSVEPSRVRIRRLPLP